MSFQCISKEGGEGKTLIISLDEHFDYSCAQGFRRFYQRPPERISKYIVDMKQTRYLDSSALAMLLDLHRCVCRRDNASVDIINCNSYILKILRLSHFDRKFDIRSV